MYSDIVSTGYKERGPDPQDVRLKDGSPLYYALLENDATNSGVLDKVDVQRAKSLLREHIGANVNAVLSCQGKTREEARSILENIDERRKAA